MNSYNSSIDSALPRKNSCESHVSIYYEQDQKKEPCSGPPIYSRNSHEKVYENPTIQINDEETTSIDLPPLTWHGYDKSPKLLTVTNTGRTILINGHWTNIRPYIEGGPLNGTYLLSQIHFHCPSEHEINGKRYPLEMHVVHYKTTYLTQEKAMQEKDGTVVIVYLFQLGDNCKTVVSQITKLGCELKEVNSRAETTEIPLGKLITPFFTNYYIYWGSLTTKRNKYLLQWIINCNPLCVTQQEVEDLSNIITSAIGLTVKQNPRLKPEFDDIYHVGEADYSLPFLGKKSTEELCTLCKRCEISSVSCSCKVEKVICDGETEDSGTTNLKLVCTCQSKTQDHEYICRKHGDKYICTKCKSFEMSPCNKCCEGREARTPAENSCTQNPPICTLVYIPSDLPCTGALLGKIFSGQIKTKKKVKMCCDVEDGPDGGIILKCKDQSLLMDYYKAIKKKKQKKVKQKKTPKPKKSSPKSKKSSSASSVSGTKSNDKLDSGAQSGESEVEQQKSSKKDHPKEKKVTSKSVEDPKVKKKKKQKKKEIEVHDSSVSLKKDKSRQSLKTITVLPQTGPSSSGLIVFTPKPSAHDGMQVEKKNLDGSRSSVKAFDGEEENVVEDKKLASPKCSAIGVHEPEEEEKVDCAHEPEEEEKVDCAHEPEEEKKIDNAECPDVKITQTCVIIDEPLSVALAAESKSSIDKEKREESTLKDDSLKSPADSPSTKSRSKSRTKVEKTKDSESPEKKKLAARKSKSKSPVIEVSPKNKASMKKKSEHNVRPDSKAVMSDVSKNKMGKTTTISEPAKSAQEVKCSVKKSTPAIENLKSDSAPQKVTKTKSIRLRKKSTEEAKGNNKADNEGQKSKEDYDIKTIYEKKQDGKKAQSLAGDSNDVKVNVLLSPGTNIKSDPSNVLAMSESDFTGEKKDSETIKNDHFSQDFTVNTAAISGLEFPSNELKEHPQGCLLMEHVLRTEDNGCSSQEYYVAIMYDQCILQEYRGKFQPQELRLGDCEQLTLVPKYPESDNFNFRLQDCFIKKQSLDQICVRVKFLLKDLNIVNVSENGENRLNVTSEKKDILLIDQQAQCNLIESGVVTSSVLKSTPENKNNEKILDSQSSEIMISQYKWENEEKQKEESKNEEQERQSKNGEQKRQSKNEEEQKQELKDKEKQKQQSKLKPLQEEDETEEPEKCSNQFQNNSDMHSQDALPASVTEQFSTDSNLKENKKETERNEKKLKSLFVKRRKTVYFIYDKVEKDESTGKKIFVGSFKTKEEVDGLKKQKVLFQENEAASASEKPKETWEAKGFLPFESKEASLKFTKGRASQIHSKRENEFMPKGSSSTKNFPSTSQDPSYKHKDLVTLHKYKPKYPASNRYKRDSKNMPIKAMGNSQKNNEKHNNVISVKEKAPKTDLHELRKGPESEPQKESPEPDGGKTEENTIPNNVLPNKNRENYSQTEVTVLGKSTKAREELVRVKSQKSLDKNESQAGLILIPVKAESLSKTEVILIEQLDESKKDKDIP